QRFDLRDLGRDCPLVARRPPGRGGHVLPRAHPGPRRAPAVGEAGTPGAHRPDQPGKGVSNPPGRAPFPADLPGHLELRRRAERHLLRPVPLGHRRRPLARRGALHLLRSRSHRRPGGHWAAGAGAQCRSPRLRRPPPRRGAAPRPLTAWIPASSRRPRRTRTAPGKARSAAGRVLPSPEPREVVRLHRRKPELFRFVVQPDEDGIPLAQLLRGRFGMSRGMIRRLKREPSVFSNGEAIPLRHRVRAGETITLLLPAAPESGVLAEPGPLDIVFEDRHLLVVDKPAGVLVHPAGYEQTGTLANAVAHRLASQGYPGGAGAVTRLDRDTSGLVLFAKHPHAHHRMSRALAEGAVSRRYIAVAHGEMRRDEGTVDAPIRRESPTSSLRLVGPGGQRAVTHFRVLARAHPSPLFPRGAS